MRRVSAMLGHFRFTFVKFQILSTIFRKRLSDINGWWISFVWSSQDGRIRSEIISVHRNLYTPFFPPSRSAHLLSAPVTLVLVHSGPSPRVKHSVPHHHDGAVWNDIAGKRSEACDGSRKHSAGSPRSVRQSDRDRRCKWCSKGRDRRSVT